jgi:hypothetical protein
MLRPNGPYVHMHDVLLGKLRIPHFSIPFQLGHTGYRRALDIYSHRRGR